MRLNIASTSKNTIKVLPLTKQLPILTTYYPIINRFCKHYFVIFAFCVFTLMKKSKAYLAHAMIPVYSKALFSKPI